MRKLKILGPTESLAPKVMNDKFQELWKKVPLKEVEALEKDLDNAFNRYWLKSGQDKNRVAKILDLTKARGVYENTRLQRLQGMIGKIGSALAILGVVTNGSAMASGIGNPSPAQAEAYNNFLAAFEAAIIENAREGGLRRNTAQRVHDTYISYLVSIDTNPIVVGTSDRAMQNWIQANCPL